MKGLRNILFFIVALVSVWSCTEEKKEFVNRETDPEKVPSVISHDVMTLISDSGVTQYRISAKKWDIYDEAKKPFWNFPTGLFLEKFDDKFDTEASIKSDSAKYFKDDQLWRLDGNVTVQNTNGEIILTQQIFWDQKAKKVYSDSFIHIEKKDRIIEGFGFTSNERMTKYEINRVSGIFPVEDFKHKNDSTATDSAAVETQTAQNTEAEK